jgi:hypothetical protein
VLKFILPLAFVLLADGGLAGGSTEPAKVAADRSAPGKGDEKGEPKSDGAHGKETAGAAGDDHGKDHAAAGGLAKAEHESKTEGKTDGKTEGKTAAKLASKAPPPKRSGKDNGVRDPGRDPDRVPTPAPGISSGAMNDEMGRTASQQKALNERERLEALSNDLSRTRSALREETVRLETLVEQAKRAGVKPAANAHGAPAKTAAAAAAAPSEGARPEGNGTMPLGDPLAPSAYYRPAPPPPNFAVQVEVVSKAMKSMKPEQAAGILGHLERGLAAEVLQRMRPADAGAILGFLKPEVGAALAAEIVTRPPVPRSKDKDDKEKP